MAVDDHFKRISSNDSIMAIKVEQLPKELDKSGTIHSGHFMVSQVHDVNNEDGEEEPGTSLIAAVQQGFNFSNASRETQTSYNFGNQCIDASLTKLFECMTLAYSGTISSPRWKHFRGLHVTQKERIRLNNLIWREWHMQYIYHNPPMVCQFSTPLSDDIHCRPEAVVLEGKYWKRRLDTVTAEYRKCRRYFKERINDLQLVDNGQSRPLEEWELLDRVKDVTFLPKSSLTGQESNTDLDLMQEDIKMEMDFTNELFATLNQPFAFPNPRELNQLGGYSEFIQPGLVQLQPNLEEIMDIDAVQELLSTRFATSSVFGDQTSGPHLDMPSSVLQASYSTGLSLVDFLTDTDTISDINGNHTNNNSTNTSSSTSSSAILDAVRAGLSIDPSHHILQQQQHHPQTILNSSSPPIVQQQQTLMTPGLAGNVTFHIPSSSPVPMFAKNTSSIRQQQQGGVMGGGNLTVVSPGLVPHHHHQQQQQTPQQAPLLVSTQTLLPPSPQQAITIMAADIPALFNNNDGTGGGTLVAVSSSSSSPLALPLTTTTKNNSLITASPSPSPLLKNATNANALTTRTLQQQAMMSRQMPIHQLQQQQQQPSLLANQGLGVTSLSTLLQLQPKPLANTNPNPNVNSPILQALTSTSGLFNLQQQQQQQSASPTGVGRNSNAKRSPRGKGRGGRQAGSGTCNVPTNASGMITDLAVLAAQSNQDKTNLNLLTGGGNTNHHTKKKDGSFAVPSVLPRKPRTIAPAPAALLATPPKAPQQSSPDSYLAQLLKKGTYPGAVINVKKEPIKSTSPLPSGTRPGGASVLSSQLPLLTQQLQTSSPLPLTSQLTSQHALVSLTSLQGHQQQQQQQGSAMVTSPSVSMTPAPHNNGGLPQNIIDLSNISQKDLASLLNAISPQLRTQPAASPTPPPTLSSITEGQGLSSMLGQHQAATAPLSSPQQDVCSSIKRSDSPSMDTGMASEPCSPYPTSMPMSPSSAEECSPSGEFAGLRGDNKKAAHLSAEQKRRFNLKMGFDLLQQLVPSLTRNPKVSKATMLQKTADYCKKLKVERSEMRTEATVLKQEIECLNSAISNVQSQLPETGVPVTRQRKDQMKEMFDEYVRTRTLDNWKFWIFSVIMSCLYDSYCNTVSTVSLEELCRTSLTWLDQCCSLVSLRPNVLNALRKLSTTTSILTEPEKVKDEAIRNVSKPATSSRRHLGFMS